MTTYPDSIVSNKFLQHMLQDKEGSNPEKRAAVWNYEEAVTLKGIDRLYRATGDECYFPSQILNVQSLFSSLEAP